MAERLQRLRQKRGVVRSSATRLLRSIEQELGEDDVNCDRLSELLAMLTSKEENLLQMDKEIEEEIPMDELDADVAKSQDYQEGLFLWKTRASRIIEQHSISHQSRLSE